MRRDQRRGLSAGHRSRRASCIVMGAKAMLNLKKSTNIIQGRHRLRHEPYPPCPEPDPPTAPVATDPRPSVPGMSSRIWATGRPRSSSETISGNSRQHTVAQGHHDDGHGLCPLHTAETKSVGTSRVTVFKEVTTHSVAIGYGTEAHSTTPEALYRHCAAYRADLNPNCGPGFAGAVYSGATKGQVIQEVPRPSAGKHAMQRQVGDSGTPGAQRSSPRHRTLAAPCHPQAPGHANSRSAPGCRRRRWAM